MFTGIVEEVGRVAAVTPLPGLTRLRIESRVVPESLRTGDSVAVNGACLTVVARDGAGFEVEATLETLRRTNLGALTAGDGVHLERPLAANGRFDGHIVQGHVDAVGRIAGRRAGRGRGDRHVRRAGGADALRGAQGEHRRGRGQPDRGGGAAGRSSRWP